MFSKLKNKLKSFLGKEKEPEEKPKKISKIPSDKELKAQTKNLKEAPLKFNKGMEQYQPDLEKIKEPEEKKGFLKKFITKISTSNLEQKDIDELFEPLELILLENNVNLNVVDKIKENLSKKLLETETKKKEIEKTIQESLKESIEEILIEQKDIINKIKNSKETFTIILFGINGSGKTTTIAKLANLLEKNNISCVLAAADTFRAASIEQLKKHGENLNIPVIAHDYGSDPASIAFDAKAYAKKHNKKCVLIDTAGRMYTKSNLLKEMEKIIRISKPDLKIFVGESITGNDATEQAKTFNDAVGIDGIILTKADVDEKGGAALSVSYITKKPIFFLGTGQEYDDLKPFSKKEIIKNLGLN